MSCFARLHRTISALLIRNYGAGASNPSNSTSRLIGWRASIPALTTHLSLE